MVKLEQFLATRRAEERFRPCRSAGEAFQALMACASGCDSLKVAQRIQRALSNARDTAQRALNLNAVQIAKARHRTMENSGPALKPRLCMAFPE